MDVRILSIQVGKPKERGADGYSKTNWTSAIFKAPIEGALRLNKLNLVGDGQADLKNHGGPNRAILLYAVQHYDYWQQALPTLNWVNGGFGENLTVEGQTEDTAAIGDIYTVGDTKVQISQPRVPCWKLARRWGQKDLTARTVETGYTGWYMRVLEEGTIEAGMTLELLERPFPQWTVRRVTNAMYESVKDPQVGAELVDCEPLSIGWREMFAERLKKQSD